MIQYIKKQFEIFELYLVSLFFLITPAIYSTKILDPVLYSRYYALSAFLLLFTVVLGVLYYKKQFKFRLGKYDKWVLSFALAYVLWNIISISVAININEAIFHALKETSLMLAFFYFYQALRNNKQGRELIIKTMVLMVATFVGIGTYQFILADFSKFMSVDAHFGYYLAQALLEVNSTFAGKNLFPMFLVMSLAFSVYSLITHELIWKIIAGFNALASLFFILILTARSAWLGLALFISLIYIFLLFYLFLSSNNFRSRSKGIKSLVLVIPALFIFMAGVFVMVSENQLAKTVKDKVLLVVSSEYVNKTVIDPSGPTSAKTRQLVWENSLQMAIDHPVIGVGAGQWRVVHPSYGLDAFGSNIRQGRQIFQRAHNDFLWIAGEVGFVGLFFYLAFYLSILWIAIKNFRESKELKVKLFSALAFASLSGFAVIMLFSFPRERIAINMVYLIMMALVLADSPFKEKSKQCDLSEKVSYSIFGILLLVLGFNMFVSYQMFDGEKAAYLAKYAQMQEKWRLLLRSSYDVENSIYTIDPFSIPMKYYEGAAHAKLGDSEKALECFKVSQDLAPYNLVALNNLATTYEKLGDQEKALEYYYKALDISPRYIDGLMNAAIVNMKLKNPIESLNLLKRIDLAQYKHPNYDMGEYRHPKYDMAVVTASKLYASMVQKSFDREKLVAWYTDENKIKLTFVTFKEGNKEFGQILMNEIGPN